MAFSLSLVATVASMTGHYRFVTGDGSKTDAGQLVILDPETWIGKPWPLLEQSGLEAELTVGVWDVLLIRNECHVCHDVIRELQHVFSVQPVEPQIALIGIDQHEVDSYVARLPEMDCLLGHLPHDREWFVTTPLRLRLSAGVCVEASVIKHWE